MGLFSCCDSTDKVVDIKSSKEPIQVKSNMSKFSMYEVTAFAKKSKDSDFEKIKIQRNVLGDDDIEFDVKFCGICHSDVHVAQDEMGDIMPTQYPCVPGHELAGIVTKVGKNVTDIKVGSKVGVGCMVDSCFECDPCKDDGENYCQKMPTYTYGTPINFGRLATNSGWTFGGYSEKYTVQRRFAIKIPDAFPLEKAGPIFCAGITTYSPLRYWGAIKGGKRVGVVGIGGLGQMAIQQAKAMGNEVYAISTSPKKEEMAKEIGASHFVVSTNQESMNSVMGSLDLILDTVSANHQAMPYIGMLRNNGVLCLLGATMEPNQIPAIPLIMGRKTVCGSAIGGMKETQECIDFCHKHGIRPHIEMITMERLSEVYEKLSGKNDTIARYVLDIEKSLKM